MLLTASMGRTLSSFIWGIPGCARFRARFSPCLRGESHSVVHVEVHQVPVISEPDKTKAGQQDREVPDFGPEPGLAVSPGTQAGQEDNDRSRGPQQAERLDDLKFQVASGAERARACVTEHNKEDEKKSHVHGADRAHPGT